MRLKRLLAFVVAFAMVMSIVPAMSLTAFAEEKAQIAGTISQGYTVKDSDRSRIYGEITGMKASESVVIELYSDDTLMSTTTLANESYLSNSTLSYNIVVGGRTSSSWNTVWEEGHPNSKVVPNKVVLYIDGKEMNTAVVTMDSEPDKLGVVTDWTTLDGVKLAANLVISTAKELVAFAKSVNEDKNSYSGKVVVLANNINLEGSETNLWTPIGASGDSEPKFRGTFDGQGYTISNLYVKQGAAYHAAGLFGATNGTIKNLTIDTAYVESLSSGAATVNGTAVVAGSTVYGATIDNVHVKNATVKGNRYVAGIVGYMDGTVTNCSVENVTIVATPDNLTGSYDNGDKVGGIVGYCNSDAVEITNCELKGTVDITAYRDVAGIVGCASTDVKVNNNTNNATVTITIDTTLCGERDNYNVGEFVGRNTPAEATGNAKTDTSSYTTTVKTAPKGTITPGYTNATSVWGEGKSNANESYVVKLYVGETVIATTSLNDIGNIIDGTYKNLTWSIPFAGSTDEYWTVEWAEGYPAQDAQPTAVELWVDGVEVAENVVKMSGPDDLNKVVWEELDIFKNYVAQVGDEKFETLADAVKAAEAGQTVKLLADIAGDASVNKAGITLDGNDKTITGKLSVTGSDITVKNVNVYNESERAIYISGGNILIEDSELVGVHGARYCYANNGDVTFKNCVITGSTYGVHFDAGNGEGNVIIDGCTITGWTSFGSAIEGVTIKDTTFENGNYDQLRFYQDATLTNVKFNPEMTIDFGKTVTTNFADCSVTDGSALTDVIYLGDIVEMGVKVYVDDVLVTIPASITVGEETTYYTTLAAAVDAAGNGDVIEILVADTYKLPSVSNKTFTIKGAVKNVVIDHKAAVTMSGSDITFDSVTIECNTQKNYIGFHHAAAERYVNCVINGEMWTYGTVAEFTNCTFKQESSGAYNLWTYGSSEVTLESCTLNSAGKSVLLYNEGADQATIINVTDSDFIASTPVEGKAAIEIDTSLMTNTTSKVVVDALTTVTGFATGSISGETLWNDKKDKTNIEVWVDDVQVWPLAPVAEVDGVKYEDLAEAIAAAEGTTVKLLSNVDMNNIRVTVDTNCTLDLAGYTLTSKDKGDNTNAMAIYINEGKTFTLADTVGGGKVVSSCYGVYVKQNATFNLTGGTIEVSGNGTYDFGVVVWNGTFNMTGGQIDAQVGVYTDDYYRANGDSGLPVNTISITDGTINAGGEYPSWVETSGDSNTTISGGTFSGNAGVYNWDDEGNAVPMQVITGGTFTIDPTEWTAEGYEAVEGEGVWTVATVKVATVTDANGTVTYYETLTEAVEAAKDGKTVTVLTDITLTDSVTIEDDMDVTIEGEGKTITAATGKDAFYVTGGKLTLSEGLNVHAPTDCVIYIRGGEVITSANLTKDGEKYSVIQGNGFYAGNVTINGGIVKNMITDKVAIYWPQDGKLTINGGTITGGTAVRLSSGELEITGGTFVANGTKNEYVASNGGSVVDTGDAVMIENIGGTSGYEALTSVSITGGTFTSENGNAVASYTAGNDGVEAVTGFITGGTYSSDVADLCATGYKAVKDGENYTVVPALPTATVTELTKAELEASNAPELTFAMNFTADEPTEAQKAYYGKWYADYVLTVNKDVTFNADGSADGYLSGSYDAWQNGAWVNVPFENVTLKAGESIKIMEYAATLMGQSGLKLTYNDVYGFVKDFDCGVFFDEEFLAANPDLEVTLELRMYNNEDETESYVIGETYVFTLPPALPTATVTELENDELTFALNFKADEVTEEQLDYYGDWYADYVLTVNKDVTFNANGGADGYLSGSYDAWQNGAWVNVPFEDVTLKAGESIKIMEYAATLMGQSGLKLTYNDVYGFVKNFDCGVFFTPKFLAANPDLVVTLELRMYNNEDETESYVIGKTYVFEAPTVVATVTAADGAVTNYETLAAAVDAAADGETVTLLADVTESEIVTIDKGITLDGNGKTITSTATRAINVATDAAVVIENLNVVCSGERGINVITKPANLTLNNVNVSGVTHYAVNVAGSGKGATITINGGKYESYSALNIPAGADNVTLTATNAELVGTNTYEDSGSNGYATIVIGGNNVTVNVTGGSVKAVAEEGKAPQAIAGANAGATGAITIDSKLVVEGAATYVSLDPSEVTLIVRDDHAEAIVAEGYKIEAVEGTELVKVVEPVYVATVTDVDGNEVGSYETLQDAIDAAETGSEITLVANVEAVNVVVPGLGEAINLTTGEYSYTGTVTLEAGGWIVSDAELTVVSAEETLPVVKGEGDDKYGYAAMPIGVDLKPGAQVRIGSGVDKDGKVAYNNNAQAGSGLRFVTEVNKSDTLAAFADVPKKDNKEYQYYIVGVNIRAEASDAVVDIPAYHWQIEEEIFTTALTNLAVANYVRKFTASTYVEVDGIRYESNEEEWVTRSIYQVAAGLLIDKEAEVDSDGNHTYDPEEERLIEVLNAYVNQTGIRLVIVEGALLAHDGTTGSTKGGAYPGSEEKDAEAFFEVSETTYDGDKYKVTLTAKGNAEIKNNTVSTTGQPFWYEYVRINNNNSSIRTRVTVTEIEAGKKYELVFDATGTNLTPPDNTPKEDVNEVVGTDEDNEEAL